MCPYNTQICPFANIWRWGASRNRGRGRSGVGRGRSGSVRGRSGHLLLGPRCFRFCLTLPASFEQCVPRPLVAPPTYTCFLHFSRMGPKGDSRGISGALVDLPHSGCDFWNRPSDRIKTLNHLASGFLRVHRREPFRNHPSHGKLHTVQTHPKPGPNLIPNCFGTDSQQTSNLCQIGSSLSQAYPQFIVHQGISNWSQLDHGYPHGGPLDLHGLWFPNPAAPKTQVIGHIQLESWPIRGWISGHLQELEAMC